MRITPHKNGLLEVPPNIFLCVRVFCEIITKINILHVLCMYIWNLFCAALC